jgi:pimeloyl-ACP methyl ester carboxylesterase
MMDVAPRIVVTADGRAVGYRRFGEGPAVALLHASPRSAAALLPLGRLLADRFTVFAFDTPGFGWSDPLRMERPDAHDYGDALMAAWDALGLQRAPLYGSHTGAAIAVAAALDHPARVTALALDGYAVFTATEQAEYLATYLAPIRPEWDGTHLAWLWSRVKDQFTVFPWYLRGQVARLPRPLAPLWLLQAVVQDFLAAGDNYRPGYAAAFRFPWLPALRRVTVPTAAMARSDDLLFKDLEKLTELPDCVTVRPLGIDDAAWAAAMAEALGKGAAGAAPAVAGPHGVPGVTDVHRVGRNTVGAIGCGAKQGRPIVLLPPIPGSARGEAALARALGRSRPVITVDLPGFGASTMPQGGDAAEIAATLLAMLGQAGMTGFDIVACGESGAFGAALAGLAPGARLVLLDPVPEAMRAAMIDRMADVAPRSDGAHLLAAWHQLRDTCLWRPWFETVPAHAIPFGHDPDVARLQAVLGDWLRGGTAGRATLAAAMAGPLPLQELEGRVAAVVLSGHPWSAGWEVPTHAAGPDRLERAEAVLRALAT